MDVTDASSIAHKPLRIIDLFSGAGGLSLGFHSAFRSQLQAVWAIDSDPDSAATYNQNFNNVCQPGDLVHWLNTPDLRRQIPPADIVIGGPPCQGFSLLNKKRAGDPRKQLWRAFMQVVELSGAKMFMMENVLQLLSSSEFGEIKIEAQRLGFQVTALKLNAADFGVPQVRRRAFLIGYLPVRTEFSLRVVASHSNSSQTTMQGLFSADSLTPIPLQPWSTVRDAIHDLPEPEGHSLRKLPPPLDLHFGRRPTAKSLARYRAIPEEGMNRVDLQRLAPELNLDCWRALPENRSTDLFGRLWWDRPANTIRTEFWKPEKGRYLHPVQDRAITHREAARLQSFPDTFVFVGDTFASLGRQIGNAVPPLLGAAVAKALVGYWNAEVTRP